MGAGAPTSGERMRARADVAPLRRRTGERSARSVRRLARTADTYEFLVRAPFGASAISGYRRAARHFGLHTLEDPTAEGSDAYRVLVHENARALARAAQVLEHAYGSDRQSAIDEAEVWLARSDVSWFAQDWKYWDMDQDEGALDCLGWKRFVVQSAKSYRITLRRVKKGRGRSKA